MFENRPFPENYVWIPNFELQFFPFGFFFFLSFKTFGFAKLFRHLQKFTSADDNDNDDDTTLIIFCAISVFFFFFLFKTFLCSSLQYIYTYI